MHAFYGAGDAIPTALSRRILRAPTTTVSPCNRNAAPSINPAAEQLARAGRAGLERVLNLSDPTMRRRRA